MKRTFDVMVSSVALVVSLPAMVVLAVLVRLMLGSPILFRQIRPGLNEVPFELVKFRTMLDLRNADGGVLEDDRRLTRFGRFLRSTSMDELPELWNVLKGEMSLVGPRPLLLEYISLYSPEQARRHEVRPGLTGWAQINGRNSISWEEKLALDVWYVENRSFILDLKILCITVIQVVCRKGIVAQGEATMPRFKGKAKSAP